jgi:hypothetical protein
MSSGIAGSLRLSGCFRRFSRQKNYKPWNSTNVNPFPFLFFFPSGGKAFRAFTTFRLLKSGVFALSPGGREHYNEEEET